MLIRLLDHTAINASKPFTTVKECRDACTTFGLPLMPLENRVTVDKLLALSTYDSARQVRTDGVAIMKNGKIVAYKSSPNGTAANFINVGQHRIAPTDGSFTGSVCLVLWWGLIFTAPCTNNPADNMMCACLKKGRQGILKMLFRFINVWHASLCSK